MADASRFPEGVVIVPAGGALPTGADRQPNQIFFITATKILVYFDVGADDYLPLSAGALFIAGQTQGDMLIFDGTSWTRLPAGVPGQVLQTQGPGADPVWVDGPLTFQGTWNAATNTPALASGVGGPGDVYIVGTAGATSLDGITDWDVGDWAVFNGTADQWEKIDNSEPVTDVLFDFTFVTGSPANLGALLAGSVVEWAQIVITTPFDDGAATVELGTAADPDAIFTSAMTNIGVENVYDTHVPLRIGAGTSLQLTISPAASTAGAGYVLARVIA